MAEHDGSEGTAEDGWVEADRAVIAAISSPEGVFTFGSDGAVFKRQKDGTWLEVEPVPGTIRAAQLEETT